MSLPRETLSKYITPGCVFVETGSRWGDQLIEALRFGAYAAWGCETDRLLVAIALQRMIEASNSPTVTAAHSGVYCISSRDCLAHLITPPPPAGARLVVFLDAHTDTHSPILDELQAIQGWNRPPEVILIDDVRLFRDGTWGVSIEEVMAAISRIGAYDLSFDAGIQAEDILVARHRV